MEALHKCDGTELNKLTNPIRRGASLAEIERIIGEQFCVDVSQASEGSQGIQNISTSEEPGTVRTQLKVRHLLC